MINFTVPLRILRIPPLYLRNNQDYYYCKVDQVIVMTPELMRACEIVFQEHKESATPIVWNRDIFKGRISIGLREMAKETLVQKEVIYFPNKAKKINTLLNATVRPASNFEEAIQMAAQKTIASRVENGYDSFIPRIDTPSPVTTTPQYVYRSANISPDTNTIEATMKWYFKPVYYYVLWPICAAILGAVIAFLLGYLALAL